MQEQRNPKEARREKHMGYLSVSEIAEKWNVSRRRVTTLCIEGRIERSQHKGNMWLVPVDAKKPTDPRKSTCKGGK